MREALAKKASVKYQRVASPCTRHGCRDRKKYQVLLPIPNPRTQNPRSAAEPASSCKPIPTLGTTTAPGTRVRQPVQWPEVCLDVQLVFLSKIQGSRRPVLLGFNPVAVQPSTLNLNGASVLAVHRIGSAPLSSQPAISTALLVIIYAQPVGHFYLYLYAHLPYTRSTLIQHFLGGRTSRLGPTRTTTRTFKLSTGSCNDACLPSTGFPDRLLLRR